MTDTQPVERLAKAGRLPRDLIIGLAILAFCAVAYWITLGFAEAPPALAQNVQPASFPRMVIGVIAALTVLMIAFGIGKPGNPRPLPKISVFITAAMMVGFVIAFDVLGIIGAMVLFSIAMPMMWGERRPIHLAAYAALFPAAIYSVFAVGLGVYFAPGLVGTLFQGLI